MTSQAWLITGVTSGFGRQLSEQLLSRGDRVLGTYRTAGSVDDLSARWPDTFHPAHLDVTDPAEIIEVADKAWAALGRIDVVVSNAGYALMGAAEELTEEQVSHQIATNLTGPIRLIRAVLPHLRRQGGGRILQILLGRRAGRMAGRFALPRVEVGRRRLRLAEVRAQGRSAAATDAPLEGQAMVSPADLS